MLTSCALILTICALTASLTVRLRIMDAEADGLDLTLCQLTLKLLNGAALLCRSVLAAHELVYGCAQLLLEHLGPLLLTSVLWLTRHRYEQVRLTVCPPSRAWC